MLKHVVMWKFKEIGERNSKEKNIELAIEKLRALPALVPQIKSLEVGKEIGAAGNMYDLVLITSFENQTAYEEYLEDSEHRRVSDFIKRVRIGRVSVDFEY